VSEPQSEEARDTARAAARRRAERVRRTELAAARRRLDDELSETQLRALTALSERLVADLLPDERVDDETWQLFCDDR
jgi:hypothetical protein